MTYQDQLRKRVEDQAAIEYGGKLGFDPMIIMVIVQAITSLLSACRPQPVPDPVNPSQLAPVQRLALRRRLRRECKDEGCDYDESLLKIGQRVALDSTHQEREGLRQEILRMSGGVEL